MNAAGGALWTAAALLLGGCELLRGLEPLAANPRYCDESTACAEPSLPRCDRMRHECLPPLPPACAAPSDCTDGAAPVCGDDRQCHPCAGPADDRVCAGRDAKTPRCAANGTCAACRPGTQAADCGGVTPICGTDGACRACALHAECESGACLPEGRCLSGPAAVVFIDNGGVPPADCKADGRTHSGTRQFPFCDVQDGLQVKQDPLYLVVAGSDEPYGPVRVTGGRVIILGPGKTMPAATISGDTKNSAVSVEGTGYIDVALDSLNLVHGGSDAVLASVKCWPQTVGPKLTIQRSTVANSRNYGVSAGLCTLTLIDNLIRDNSRSGVIAEGGLVILTGNEVRHNSDHGFYNTSAGTVILSNNRVADNGGFGVWLEDSISTVDGNRITGNTLGGILATRRTQYQITNNVIAGNGGGRFGTNGVSLGSAASGVFAFNTVVLNRSNGSQVGGVYCDGGQEVAYSIVWNNTRYQNSQFSNCKLTQVVSDPEELVNASVWSGNPAFVDAAADFHLRPNEPQNLACCVDKVQSPTTPNHDHDVDGASRPKGAGWDIGAHEVQ